MTKSVNVAVRVLEAVAASGPIGVSDVSRHTGVPKATVQRMLVTWNNLGWVRRAIGEDSQWSLTGELLRIALRHDGRGELLSIAHPLMLELSQETGGETIHLTIEDGFNIQLLDKVEGSRPVRTNRLVGSTSPINATSTGLAILSCYPDDYIELMFADWSFAVMTEETISDYPALVSALAFVRHSGFAFVTGTNEAETSAIAAPVRRKDGSPAGAISISMPTTRITEELVDEFARLVKQTAKQVSEALST